MRCAAVCVCSIYSPAAAAAEGSYHSALEIHSTPPLSLSRTRIHGSIARELKRWRFIIPCRAATAKNSRENEFTECVSVCEKYTANRCAHYHERKEREREQTSIFLIPDMLAECIYVEHIHTQYSGNAAAAVINIVANIYFNSAHSYYIEETIFFIEELCLVRAESGRQLFLRPCGISTAFAFINEKIKSNCPRPRLWGA
jgi:hypothetical protein